jgi:stage II sporulation protein D
MTISGEGLGSGADVTIEGGKWLLVKPGRALIIAESATFSLFSAKGDRSIIDKTAAKLRNEGSDAYISVEKPLKTQEREVTGSSAEARLGVKGIRSQEEAEKIKGRLPKELRGGVEVILVRDWTPLGSLALKTGTVSIRPVNKPERVEPSNYTNALRVSWVSAEGNDSGAAHGVYRGEMTVCDVGGKTRLINLVGMEDYLKGVVPSEMPWRFAAEALKAQAVAARTYALSNINHHRKDGFDLCAEQHCQVYGGIEAEKEEASRAVEETAGLVMRTEKGLVPAYFHSTCGGYTEDASSAWEGSASTVKRVSDVVPKSGSSLILDKEEDFERFLKEPPEAYCEHSPLFRWQRNYSREELQKKLGEKFGDLVYISVKKRTPGGRVSQLLLKGTKAERLLKGQEIRRFFGEQPWKGLPSTFFFVSEQSPQSKEGGNPGVPEEFNFTGAGWGHGVGMCQYGADGMAKRGSDFKSILKHYYGQFVLCDEGTR